MRRGSNEQYMKTANRICRLVSLALFVLVLSGGLSLFASAESVSAYGFLKGGIEWSLSENGTLLISGVGAMPDFEKPSDSPWYPKRESVRSVKVEEGIAVVGDYAFAGLAVSQVSLAESVSVIGKYAFSECIVLEKINLPKNLVTIGEGAFQNCMFLRQIDLPESLALVGQNCFSGCYALCEVYYGGKAEGFDAIDIGEGNLSLTGADIVYSWRDRSYLPKVALIAAGFVPLLFFVWMFLSKRHADAITKDKKPFQPRSRRRNPPAYEGI